METDDPDTTEEDSDAENDEKEMAGWEERDLIEIDQTVDDRG